MRANYPNCYRVTRQWEGGNDDDPRDPGGRTSRGIIQREYDKYRDRKGLPRADVWRASEDEIAEIYRANYWDAVLGDQWPAGPDLVVWDCAVHSGPARSKQFARGQLGGTATAPWSNLAAICRARTDKVPFIRGFCASRLSFLHGLRIWSFYAKGFTRRVAGVEAMATKMALSGAGKPDGEVIDVLKKKADEADSKSKGHAGGAAGAGTGTASGGATVDWHSVDWAHIAFYATTLVALGVATWFFIHWWRAHKDRAEAFRDVIKSFGR